MPGLSMVYAASSAALAVLEVRVHLDLPVELLPDDYMLLKIDLGGLDIESLEEIPAIPVDFGNTWLRALRTPVLSVPSMIVPESANLLLNPSHPAAHSAKIVAKRRFEFDPRLWV